MSDATATKPAKRLKAKIKADIDDHGDSMETKVTVERTVNGSTKKEEKVLAVHQFVTEPAVVSVAFGGTANLGNFESAKFSCAISIPCYREEVDDAYKWAKRYVEKKVKFTMKKIREELEEE